MRERQQLEKAQASVETRLGMAGDALRQEERSTARLRTIAAQGTVSRDEMERAELNLASVRSTFEAAEAQRSLNAAISEGGAAFETVGNKLKTMVHVIQGNDPFAGTVLSARNAITAITALGATMATAIPPVTVTVTA